MLYAEKRDKILTVWDAGKGLRAICAVRRYLKSKNNKQQLVLGMEWPNGQDCINAGANKAGKYTVGVVPKPSLLCSDFWCRRPSAKQSEKTWWCSNLLVFAKRPGLQRLLL